MKTNKINKVLIAIDYDESVQKVAVAGYEFAKAMGAEVVLVHVISSASYYSSLNYSPVFGFLSFNANDLSLLHEAEGLKSATNKYLNKLKLHLSDESIQTMVVEGEFGESILSTAIDIQADLIVMGSHSRNWVDEVLLGSVTKNVLHETLVPLLIIPIKNK